MKNLPQRERQRRRNPSSYSRKQKQPYQYSAEYRGWREAIIHNRDAQPHHIAWVRKFVDVRFINRDNQKAVWIVLREAHEKAISQRKAAA